MSKQEEISATEKFTKDINVVFSQYHSEQMSVAVKRGILDRVKNGYAVNRPPLGYSKTDMSGLFKVNRQGRALREILKNLANGKTDFKTTVVVLVLAFCNTSTGLKPWSKTKIKRLLSDPYYAGYISYNGQFYQGLHEPLITKEEHDMLLDLLHDISVNNSLESFDKSL